MEVTVCLPSRPSHANTITRSSEAVQLGGAASAAGLVGIWTGAHHETGDPAGPFWAFKVNAEYVKPFVAWTL